MERNGKKTVMVVDDNPVTRSTIETVLEDQFEVIQAESGADCLMQVATFPPDLILLDIEMPGLDGYQTCEKLRQTHSMPIVFVSARGSVDERVKAFQVGGDDFIVKPFDGEILFHKVQRILAPHTLAATLEVQKDTMQAMAMDLLAITVEGKELLNFVIDSLNCQHFEDLADRTVDLMKRYGLDCILEIRHSEGISRRTTSNGISPLDESLLGNLPDQIGLFAFKQRLLINQHSVSLMVPNMPTAPETADRLKNNLLTVVSAIESLVSTISMRRDAALTTESLQVAALNAHEATRGLQNDYHQQQTDTQILLYGLIEKMEKSYFSLGLTEGQEARISNLLRSEANEILDLFRHGSEALDVKFSAVMDALAPSKKDTGDVWL